MKKISVIIPVFNEVENLLTTYTKVSECLQKHTEYVYEIIFIDDGSKDASWQLIQEFAFKDPRIKGIHFSRNFGHQMALTAGYDCADGDAIISMDADLQDPPELIHALIKAWEQGADIVYARREKRNDSFLKNFCAKMYYKLLYAVADVKVPQHVGDFRLIDKKVHQQLKIFREKARYLRGMIAWIGFKHTFIDFVRPERLAGTPGYTWRKSLRLAFDGLAAFSLFPLKVAAFAGIFVIVTGSTMLAYITVDALLNQVYYPLFKWLVTIIYIFMGVQFLLLWLLGEYIGRIFEQQKERPLYIVAQKINLS